MRKIKKFEPLSVMRIAAICYGAMGLLEGLFMGLLVSLKMFAAPTPNDSGRFTGPLLAVVVIIAFPILLGAIGALTAGLGAVIYNVTARYVGGIEVEVE